MVLFLDFVENTRFELVGNALPTLFYLFTILPSSFGKGGVKRSLAESLFSPKQKREPEALFFHCLVENTRFELVTSCMPCKRSSQLS